MKKVLIAIDGAELSEGAFEFARQLNELHPIYLTGLFIPHLSNAALMSYSDAIGGPAYIQSLEKEDAEQTQNTINRFEALCRRNHITFKVPKGAKSSEFPGLQAETRFADLLILSSEVFYNGAVQTNQSSQLQEAINTSECPVIVVPEKFRFPKVNIMAYDGTASSVFAIKQFAYLFPELKDQQTLFVYSSASDEKDLPQGKEIEELVRQHFLNVSFLKLDVDPGKGFADWVTEHPNAILACGSFGRSQLSQFFRKSFVTDVIEKHKLPVFIAHR